MKRILIIEDNKTLAKLISKKISSGLDFKVDLAYKLSEAKLFLKMFDFFIVLTDLNLPDAPNGEVIDYLTKKDIRTIVLTSNIDKKFRKQIMSKNIIDYVNKGAPNNISYIINTIKRLQKNQEHKVLVVDDSMIFRKQMVTMLENFFIKVYAVAHGEEALNMLKTHPDISLVLTDYNMPVMDGMQLTIEIRNKYTKNDLSILVLSSNEDDEINAMFLKNGANDYIKKPFSKEEFSCRVNNALEAKENIDTITNHTKRDFLTGLYNKQYFFKEMNSYLEQINQTHEQFAIAMIDIDNIKNINNTYGHEAGDKSIITLSEILRSATNHKDLVSRFDSEEFCVVLKNINSLSTHNIFQRIRKEIENIVIFSHKGEKIKFTTSIGVVIHKNDTLDESINQADMLLYKAKQNGKNQIVFE